MTVTLTLHEAAEELGVHYMTAYRYVRLGLLDATKVGGLWQVEEGAIDAFRNGSAAGPVEPGSPAPWKDRLEMRLVEGDGQGAWGVVEAAMAAGADVRSVYVDMVGPAMVSIGARWAAGEFDVSVEHLATGIVMRVIGRLGPRCARRGRARGSIVVGSPVGEFHALPPAMLSDLMRLQGWEVVDLGPNTPSLSFIHAAERTSELSAVALSITHDDHLAAAAECCSALEQAMPGVTVIVGGQAIRSDEHARRLGADARASDDHQLHEFLITR